MRTLSAEALAALDAGRFIVRSIVKIESADAGALCFWDDVGDIAIGGDTYIGAAGRFTLEPSLSVADLSTRQLDIHFSGLDTAVVSIIDGIQWHQRPVTVQRIIVATDSPIGTTGGVISLVPEFVGFADQIIWDEKIGDKSNLTLRCESTSREFSRSSARTASDADQRERDAADGFFSFAASAANTVIDWGRDPKAQQQTVQQQRPTGLAGWLDKIF